MVFAVADRHYGWDTREWLPNENCYARFDTSDERISFQLLGLPQDRSAAIWREDAARVQQACESALSTLTEKTPIFWDPLSKGVVGCPVDEARQVYPEMERYLTADGQLLLAPVRVSYSMPPKVSVPAESFETNVDRLSRLIEFCQKEVVFYRPPSEVRRPTTPAQTNQESDRLRYIGIPTDEQNEPDRIVAADTVRVIGWRFADDYFEPTCFLDHPVVACDTAYIAEGSNYLSEIPLWRVDVRVHDLPMTLPVSIGYTETSPKFVLNVPNWIRISASERRTLLEQLINGLADIELREGIAIAGKVQAYRQEIAEIHAQANRDVEEFRCRRFREVAGQFSERRRQGACDDQQPS